MKKAATKSIIGILGGMGPQASAHLLDLIIKLSIKEFGAKNDDDFPEILLDSVSIPDFISSQSRKRESLEILRERVRFLNQIRPSCLAIACNTAHILLSDLQNVSKAPFVSLIEEVTNSVDKAKLKKVGILGTPVTIKSRLYQKALQKLGIDFIAPKELELRVVERIIRKVIAGLARRKDKALLLLIANRLRDRGAQGIILGCTELPLVFPKKQKFPVFDSLKILAEALLRNHYK